MISVDNFYWLLYHSLLQHFSLSDAHFYPFGTTDRSNLVVGAYMEPHQRYEASMIGVHRRSAGRVLYHDQEPIDYDKMEKDLVETLGHNYRVPRIVANSERCDQKRTVFKANQLLDWYYFYHGFAALYWLQDLQYFDDLTEPIHRYISLNHIVNGARCYRMALTAQLLDRKLDQHGLISFHGSEQQCHAELHNKHSCLSVADKILISRVLHQFGQPRYVDTKISCGSLSALVGHPEVRMWQQSWLHVVNETVFYQPKLHLTEKVFKPIACRRPFVLVAAPGNLAYLRSYGFKTFDPWIDESYDNEPNHSRRLLMIADQIDKICQWSDQHYASAQQEIAAVCEFNHRHFFGLFRQIIAEELVQNFLSCIGQWNNGRVDKVITGSVVADVVTCTLSGQSLTIPGH